MLNSSLSGNLCFPIGGTHNGIEAYQIWTLLKNVHNVERRDKVIILEFLLSSNP